MISAPESGAEAREGARPGRFAGSLSRMIAGLTVVLLAAVLALRVMDAIPGLLTGRPRGVMSVGTIEEAERQIRARLWMPAYFPDSLRWPAAAVEVYAGPPAAVALTFAGASPTNVRLVLCETLDATGNIPFKLLPPGLMLESARTTVGKQVATLMRVELEDGRLAHELHWAFSGRTLALRYDGPLDQMLLIANSVTDRS